MTKLTYLEPRLAPSVRPTLAPAKSEERERNVRSPWRNWYKLKRWREMRDRVLLVALFTCARCGRLEGDTSKLVCDHKRPHRGNPDLFWDERNLQCLCWECHSGDKQREEQGMPVGVWD